MMMGNTVMDMDVRLWYSRLSKMLSMEHECRPVLFKDVMCKRVRVLDLKTTFMSALKL